MPSSVQLFLSVSLFSLTSEVQALTAAAGSVSLALPTSLPAAVAPTVMMNAGSGEGFNSFRRWPSAASVSLTSGAQNFFGLSDSSDVSMDQMRDCNKCSSDTLERVLNAQPIADQRGEKVQLDVDGQGHLQWIKVV